MLSEDVNLVVKRCSEDIKKLRQLIDTIESDLLSQDNEGIQSASIAIASLFMYLGSPKGFDHVCNQLYDEVKRHNDTQTRH